MWARTVEVMLACWLAASPFTFSHPAGAVGLWVNDLTIAALIAAASLTSFHRSLWRMHLLNLLFALWLIVFAVTSAESPPPPAHQNHVMIGLLVGMIAIVPSRCDELPRAWREFYEARLEKRDDSHASAGIDPERR